MFVSAEIRWFWKGVLPEDIESWFRSGLHPPHVETPRVDEYLVDRSQTELGVKKRGGNDGVEVKGLVALGGHQTTPFEGRTQIWTKWLSRALTIEDLACVSVEKSRWLRKYDTSGSDVTEVALGPTADSVNAQRRSLAIGCQLELVTLAFTEDRTAWWSIGFEAFGRLDTIEPSLHRTLAHLAPSVPDMKGGFALSYPEWLARFVA